MKARRAEEAVSANSSPVEAGRVGGGETQEGLSSESSVPAEDALAVFSLA